MKATPLILCLALILVALTRSSQEHGSSGLQPGELLTPEVAAQAAVQVAAPDSLRESSSSTAHQAPAMIPADEERAARVSVSFRGRDRADALFLEVSTHAEELVQRIEVADDLVVLRGLPAGELVFELRTLRRRSLARLTHTLEAGGDHAFEMAWPERLAGERFGQLVGSLRVPPMAQEPRLFARLSLDLIPVYDSEAQRRSQAKTLRLPVVRLAQLSADTYAWDFERVPVGSYQLKLVPLGFVQDVLVTAESGRDHLQLDLGMLGHTLVSFVDSSGGSVFPERVSVSALRKQQRPLTLVMHRDLDPQAYDQIGVPGEYRIDVQDPVFGSREFFHTLQAGWGEVDFELVPVMLVEVSLDGVEGPLGYSSLHAEGLNGGVVLSKVLTRSGTADSPAVLRLQVDRAGQYRCWCERDGRLAELEFEVSSTRQKASWDLTTLAAR